jgi:repressor LexA
MNPTPKQRACLAFIAKYIDIHHRPPAEAEMQAFFGTTPASVHQMVITLTEKGLITRESGKPRSIRLVAWPDAAAVAEVEEDLPSRPPDEITEPLDPPIASLVEILRADSRTLTKGSCWGHGKKAAYIDLAVASTAGLRAFVDRLNLVDRHVRDEAFFDVSLNWSEEVVTSCAFDLFPDWIMLSWTIEGAGLGGSPSAATLAKIAKAYKAASKAPAHPSRRWE